MLNATDNTVQEQHPMAQYPHVWKGGLATRISGAIGNLKSSNINHYNFFNIDNALTIHYVTLSLVCSHWMGTLSSTNNIESSLKILKGSERRIHDKSNV